MQLRHHMRGRRFLTLLVVPVLGVAACSGSTTGGTVAPSATTAAVAGASVAPASPSTAVVASPTESPTAPPAAAESPAASATDGPTAVPTSIDPCQLITSAEAGQLAGATFGAGKESTSSGNAKLCVYGAQTTNVFTVSVAIAPSEAIAKADEKAAQAELQANAAKLGKAVNVTQLPNFAPGTDAVLVEGGMTIGNTSIGESAMYVLRGTTFAGFSDLALSKAPPSASAMKSEAMTILGRLP